MRIPVEGSLIQTYPDAQYDDDLDDSNSKGMEAKHGKEYVTGMFGNEQLQPKKAMVGGSAIDLA